MTSTAEGIEDPRFPAAFADMQIQQANNSPKPRLHHTRSRTVSHQKDYLDPAVMAVVVEAAAAAAAKDAAREREIDMYYPPSGELEQPPSTAATATATATMRPRSASATLLSPGEGGDQSFVLHRDRSVKSLTQRLAAMDIDRLAFQDSKSAEYEDHKPAEKATETIESKPQQQAPPPSALQQVQVHVHKNGHRENYKSYADDSSPPPPSQKYPTVLANAKPKGNNMLDMGDLDTSILDFKMPELKESGLAPSARHITLNRNSGTVNLISPLPDQR